MKILYTNFHAGAGQGGHTTYISRLAERLAGRHTVAVAVPATSTLYRKAGNIPGVIAYPQQFPTRLYQMPNALRTMREVLRKHHFDVVHVNGSADHRLVALASLFLRNRPRIVMTKHNDIAMSFFGASVRARLGTDHVIAVCNHVAGRLADSPYRRVGVSTILNGVDCQAFRPLPQSEAAAHRHALFQGRADGRIVIGSNAGTGDYKGWLDMVRAVSSLPKAVAERLHIAIAGSPLTAAALAQVRAMGMEDRLSYVGQLDDVRPFLSAIDVGFVLSHRVETISFACREMMAMGKPVMVSRYAGLPENIRDSHDGWIVPPQNPSAVATILASIVADNYDIAAMGAAARHKSVDEFGIEEFVSKTESVYLRVAAHPYEGQALHGM